jgi:hypothetical protein
MRDEANLRGVYLLKNISLEFVRLRKRNSTDIQVDRWPVTFDAKSKIHQDHPTRAAQKLTEGLGDKREPPVGDTYRFAGAVKIND